MTKQATVKKIKMSITLSPEVVAYVKQSRKRRKAASNSEAMDMILRESMLLQKQAEIDAAYREYYDNVSDEILAEERQWAEGTASNMWLGIPE